MLCASRFSAPLDERIIALSSPGSWTPDKGAAASFLLSLGLLTSALLAGGAVAVLAPEFAFATVVPGVAAGWTGAAASEVAAGPAAESGTDDCFWFGSVGDSGAGAELVAAAGRAAGWVEGFTRFGTGSLLFGEFAIPARASTRSICG